MSTDQLDVKREAMLHSRAVEAVIWGMPVVNFQRMFQAFVEAVGGGANEVLFWSHLPDWRNQTLTPNPDTIYFMPFFDTTRGPVVVEIPRADGGSITGSLMDAWQCALEDVGRAGVDQGKGGRYLILPPDYSQPIPEGYIALHCDTFRGYGLCRSNVVSSSADDVAEAVAYGKQIKLYPLNEADRPQATAFRDAGDVVLDSLIPFDARFFDSLNTAIQSEPWLIRDKAMIHQLASLGIGKGLTFDPDEPTTGILTSAAEDARVLLDGRYASLFAPPYFSHTRWAVPIPADVIHGQQSFYEDADCYPVDDRAVMFSIGFFSAKRLGSGQFYLMTITDNSGEQMMGAKSYRLRVPPRAPVTLYWSATAYDRRTHGLILGMPRASRASNSADLEANSDDSVDVYFGPQPPEGKEPNWIPTDPNSHFEVLFRFYGPTQPLFDKTWQLPDIEPVEPSPTI
ncbi:DUF1254 domain-containing protein [Mycolicibacterium chubuense]|nr:DUF1254 domain-containing protein [Mycolicibacterium chubuense]